jgi:hypothetical protein
MGGESEGGVMWMIGSFLGMTSLQGLLLIIHRSGVSRPRSGQPSPVELFIGILIVVTLHRCFGQILVGMRAILFIGLSEFVAKNSVDDLDHQSDHFGIGDVQITSIWYEVVSILETVVITWSIHLGLVFFLDTWIPFWRELRQNRQKTLKKVDVRLMEIYSFLESTFQDPFSGFFDSTPGEISDDLFKAKGQAIHLERRQTYHPSEGQRRLSWNVVVNKDAMDEMKETLGPPGGFGELGFNVARDGVRFEAMGVGTSFNLMFRLREDETGRLLRNNKSRRKQVKFA